MIILQEISKKIGSRTLFEDVTCTFHSGHRYGLTGPNGSGKSTLLGIMMDPGKATGGSVSLPKKTGVLRQNIEPFREMPMLDCVIMGNERLWNAMLERELLYEKEMTDAIGMKLGELEEIVADENGYTAESDAEILLIGMGIESDLHGKKVGELPTDLQFRVLLCQALFGEPDALLLDEPTNHLDLESIKWLEGFLKEYAGTLIVVSHDRHFLNSVTTQIADIDYDTIIIYPGNYDEMIVAKTAVRARTESENKAKEKKVSQLKEFVAKFSAGTRASQVQSRLREINRLQSQELKKSNIQRPYIHFEQPEKQPGKLIFRMQKISKSYDDHPQVFDPISLEIARGDKIAVIGNNGRGKTTLLKMLSQVLKPSHGKIEVGHNIDVGYFPQNHRDLVPASTTLTSYDWLKQYKPSAYETEVRGVLGKLLFSGDDSFKETAKLSGGETARLILGKLMLCDHSVLILDEPNNHLDLESVSALSIGLSKFTGTVIFASHDRDLIDSVATSIIALEEDGVHIFHGNFTEYLRQK